MEKYLTTAQYFSGWQVKLSDSLIHTSYSYRTIPLTILFSQIIYYDIIVARRKSSANIQKACQIPVLTVYLDIPVAVGNSILFEHAKYFYLSLIPILFCG